MFGGKPKKQDLTGRQGILDLHEQIESAVKHEMRKAKAEMLEYLKGHMPRIAMHAMEGYDERLTRIDEKFSIIRQTLTCSHQSVHFEHRGRFDGDTTYIKTCAECGYIIGPCTERQKLAYEYDEKAMELSKLKAVLDQIDKD